MADRTTAQGTMSREELASYFVSLAEEFGRDEGDISVRVGNKSVTLQPPTKVEYDIAVVERSSVIRGNRETVTIEVNWKP